MPDRNLLIYCDESLSKGAFFSNFYGGALIEASDRESIEHALDAARQANGLNAELKWTKISAGYKDKYIAFIDAFFDLVAENRIKLRIMFTQNSNRPLGLTDDQIDNAYFLLYYQLIKHAFGLAYCGTSRTNKRVSIYLDDIPDNREKYERFREFVASLSNSAEFQASGAYIPISEITDVDSKKHDILQGLDIVLGAIQFRLNNMHLEKPPGQWRRAKRTVAKEAVYKHILRRIQAIYPNFNIGVSTSRQGDPRNVWRQPYRHWLFVPKDFAVVPGQSKKDIAKRRKAPQPTTSTPNMN
ncbi:DUF3800 domain-containing protein [Aureimonas flava]|uniref:DUF3800 domain-containing protein n=1 Tax=Aureimonas flava TaxID=2320271 RepID=A0A3A1WKU7_9HYPH|nr:DUF3800 domain-containing protein [Aureimonas flava]RIY00870.1 DUF3800 domain-containing protein [Aureimonas flava]